MCVLPEEYNVVGVIVATIITNLLICHIVEPHVLFKYEFIVSAIMYYLRNYMLICLFTVCLFVLSKLMVTTESVWSQLLANGFVSVGISLPVVGLMLIIKKDFRIQLFGEIRKA